MGKLYNKAALTGVHPDLVEIAGLAAKNSKFDLWVVEGLRTPERQAKLVKTGKSQTNNSRHLTGHAIDLAPYVAGKLLWDWSYYNELAPIVKAAADELGTPIEWGGDWKSFPDGPHWQLPWANYPKVAPKPTKIPVAKLTDSEPVENEEHTEAETEAEDVPVPDRKFFQTRTAKGATVAGVTTAAAGAVEVVKQASDVKEFFTGWGDNLPWLIAGVALAGFLCILWIRWDDYKKGYR